jgi:NADPH2:quinone reductase
MRAGQITRFGGPEVLDIVDIPEPEAGQGQSSPTSPPQA